MGLTAALAALAVSVIPASVAEAAPDETDFWDSVDVSGLEALQAYSGGGKVPGGPDGSWYSYPEGADAAVPYTDLPEQYDLRTQSGLVPEIRDQGIWGTCWSFGTMASIESNAILEGYGSAQETDFSERFLAWHTFDLHNGEGYQMVSGGEDRLDLGGNRRMTTADTTAWIGPVAESMAPYQNNAGNAGTLDDPGDWSLDPSLFSQVPAADEVHVQNVDYLPETARFADQEQHTGYSLDWNAVRAVKQAILENGIVDVSYYASMSMPGQSGEGEILNFKTYAHYCPVWTSPNHEVSIVGWDDNYSSENFTIKPKDENGDPADGAWIVRNSWGRGSGAGVPDVVDENGYFYISYYDQTITEFSSYQVDVKDADGSYSYDHNYQYDYLGEKSLAYMLPDTESYGVKCANVFEAEGNERLEAVSASTVNPGSTVEIEIYKLEEDAQGPTEGELVLTQTEQVAYGGYHTLELSEPVILPAGQKFSVVEKIYCGELGYEPVELGWDYVVGGLDGSASYTSVVTVEEGQSFSGRPDADGTYEWTDVTDIEPAVEAGYTVTYGNMMIKAFTTDLPSDGIVTVDILHTNDIHGRSAYSEGSVFGFDRLAALVEQEQPDLVIDAGDLYHGQAFATLEEGGSMAELVQAVGYDIITPGNHDWNYGKERLKELASASGVTMLAGNITENGADFFGNDGTYIKDIIDEDGDALRVGVLAVYDPDIVGDTAPSNVEGLTFADDAQTATDLAAQLREQGCDLVVALSHQLDCGAFLAQTSGIDVLIAGHEHAVINETFKDAGGRDVLVAETGCYFANVGSLSITCHVGDGTVQAVETTLGADTAAGIAPDPEVTELLAQISSRQAVTLQEVIGTTGVDLDGRWESVRIGQTGLGRLVAAAYIEETGADIAFENGGGIRTGRILKKGDITYRDIIDTAPFGNYIVTKKITGADVLAILEQSIETGIQSRKSYDEWVETGSDQVRWPDNCGSYLQFAGIHITYDPDRPAGERIVSAKVGGQPLEKDRLYTIATNNFVALGEDYTCLKDAPECNQYGACDEAVIRFVKLGQEKVDQAATAVWMEEAADIVVTEPGTVGDPSGGISSGLSGSGVDTGDAADLTLPVLLLAASCGCIAIILRRRRSGADR